MPIYDDWPDFPPYGDRLELRIRPRWPAKFILKWLAAGIAYGGVLASVAIAAAALIGGGSVPLLGFLVAGGLFYNGCTYVALIACICFWVIVIGLWIKL